MRNLLHYFSSSIRLLFVLLVSGTGWGQTTTISNTSENFTEIISGTSTTTNQTGVWVVPCGVTEFTVIVFGGGGGGGSSQGTPQGSGGGGGGYALTTYTNVTPGASFSFQVGRAGAGSDNTSPGGSGGQTWFQSSTFLFGNGGTGGQSQGTTPGNGGTAGGTGALTFNSGNIGGVCTGTTGGRGGNNGFGTGGGAINESLDAAGANGNRGGGGAGGNHASGGRDDGGRGGFGTIIITYQGPFAGENQYLSCGFTSTVMSAQAPVSPAVGTWSVVSGSATISSPNSPTSSITGLVPGTCANLLWSWTNPSSSPTCRTVSNTVVICIDGTALCNDNPCNAYTIPVNTTCVPLTFNNANSTPSEGMVQPGCGSFSQTASGDVWYQAVVPANGVLSVTVTDGPSAGTFYPGIAFYSGDCNNLIHSGCEFSGTSSGTNTYTGTPGEIVYIRIWDALDTEIYNFNICAQTHTNAMGTIVTGNTTLACDAIPSETFTDPGGNGNYLINQSAFYTICPDEPGTFVSVNFTSFSLGSGDQLIVMNGSSSQSSVIGQYTGTTIPSTITSSSADGCLTFAFHSNGTFVSSGWNANVTCSDTEGDNTAICSSVNCSGGCGQWVCGGGNFPTENGGTSGVNDLTNQTSGCIGGAGERSSKWFYIQFETDGTFELTLDGPGGQDYDFSVYGPTTNFEIPCPTNTGEGPIRCSYSAASNPVGIGNGATDFLEDGGGDGWVAPIEVKAGETYAVLLSIFQNGNPQPTIDISFGGTASLDCSPTVLPSELMNFEGMNQRDRNLIQWMTSTERNSDYFQLERSLNGEDWFVVGVVDAAGNSVSSRYYFIYDYYFFTPTTYYRLKQVDNDGEFKYSKTVAISSEINTDGIATEIFPNPANDQFSFVSNVTSKSQELQVSITNSRGQSISIHSFDNIDKGELISIPTDNLSNGMYTIIITQGDLKEIKKLSIVR